MAEIKNEYIITNEIYDEYIKGYSRNINHLYFFWIALGIVFAALITGYIIGHETTLLAIAIFFALVFFVSLIANRKGNKLMYLRECECTLISPPSRSFSFGEFTISVNNPNTGGTADYPYDIIVKKFETSNLFVLISRAGNGFIIKKDSFTAGTLQELKLLINDKCVNLKTSRRKNRRV